MKITELYPEVTSKTEFHLSKVKFVPEVYGCYVITNFFNDILYIGLTNNLKTRIKQHLDNPHKTKLTELGVAHYFYYKAVDNESELTKLERGWFNHYELTEGKLPILNSVHSPL